MKCLLLTALLLLAPASAWARAGGGGGGGGGGCFPAGTMISVPAGAAPIETLRPGDKVLAFSGDRLVETAVKEFYKKKDQLLTIETDKGSLSATAEHPLLARNGYTEARALRAGDAVAVIEGGRRVWATVSALKRGPEAEVYNLEVSPPHNFIAGGFVVHNKGGGYRSRSSYYSRYGRHRTLKEELFENIFLIIGLVFVAAIKIKKGLGGASRPEGTLHRGMCAGRAGETTAILRSLAAEEPSMAPPFLEQRVKEAFLDMQKAWQANDYSSMTGRMMPRLQATHSAKVEAMRARGQINMMEDVTVHSVDFVHVRFTPEPAERSFTALISASAKDYTIDEADRSLVSGSRQSQAFQEFWTFQLLHGTWVPARIDQTSDDSVLTAPNLPAGPGAGAASSAASFAGLASASFSDPFTTAAAAPSPVPAAAAFASPFDMPISTPFAVPLAAAAPVPAPPQPPPSYQPPPPPPKPVLKNLNSFAAPGQWDRQKMEIAATLAFLGVYSAWEKGSPSEIQKDLVFPETLEKLSALMIARRSEGMVFEFSGLYARKAEVVLTAEASKSRLGVDEFTARITALARRALVRDGKTLHRDEAPEPFTEYWVFARNGAKWLLKDILHRLDQEPREGVQDIAPTPVQIEWYWQN